MAYQRQDHYYRKAKSEGKASRAAYKLQQLQERFRLLKPGVRVLDLGCAPGGWMQEAARMVSTSGLVVGVDLQPSRINVPPQCRWIVGDMTEPATLALLEAELDGKAHAVLSDMAPHTSGIAFADAHRSFALANIAFETALHFLIEGGHFVVKIFPGEDLPGFQKLLSKHFTKVHSIVPAATRKTSSELYLVCIGFRAEK